MAKIGISGTHGVGKSFYLYELANKLKLKHPTKEISLVQEIARKCPFPINQIATVESQQWMFFTQITKEIEAEKINDIIVCDRTLIDYAAYTLNQFPELYYKLEPYLVYHLSTYDKIYFKLLKNNNKWLVDDGVRDIDPVFQSKIDSILQELYNKHKSHLKNVEII